MNTIGTAFRCTTWGESHGEAMGCVIDGCPANLEISCEDIRKELERDIVDKDLGTTRIEPNNFKILSGIFENKTLGTPICITIPNENYKSQSYKAVSSMYRPGHAEFTYHNRYGTYHPYGGGRASGRECIARLAAGAVAKKILSFSHISFESSVEELAGVKCLDEETYLLARKKCLEIGEEGDSTGGIVKLVISGVPEGIGSPTFGKLHAQIMQALATIGGVKGIEIGLGFESARLRGSEYNDSFTINSEEKIIPEGNNAGGFLGGISTGLDLIFRIAVKPTPSIYVKQKTVDWKNKDYCSIELYGRYDINFAPRVAPIAESMAALVLVDQMILSGLINPVRIKE